MAFRLSMTRANTLPSIEPFQWLALQIPLAQSYIDIFLSGALQLQEAFNLTGEAYRRVSPGKRYGSFIEETIRTTSDWNKYWINDRATPLLPEQSPWAPAIDDALWQFVPHSALQGMRFPGQSW